MHDTVSDLVEMPVPDALLFDRLLVSKLALESRRVSVAKFKTHVETILTFSLKNMKGCIGGQRQGDAESLRVEFHLRGLNQALVDVNKLLRPDFALVEGLAAMEGIGPGRWISHMRHDAGVLAGGFDPVAVDAVCCAIAGTEPSQIKHVMLAAEAGLGTADLAGIRLVGTPLREARIPDFVLPTGNVAEMSPDPNLLITNGGACSHCISALTGALAMVKKDTLRQGLRSPLEVVMGKEARPKQDPSRRITLGRCSRHLVGPGTEEVTGCPATASYIVRALEAIARREESQAAGGR